MVGYKARRFSQYLRKSFWILLAWTFISNFIFFLDYFSLVSSEYLSSDYDFKSAFIANLIVAVSAGLFGGFLTVHLMDYWLRKYAFWKALLFIIIAYTLAAVVVSFLGSSYLKSEQLGISIFHGDVLEGTKSFFTSWIFLKNYIIWLFIVIGTLIVLMVNAKYGPGVFADYLMGKYFMPKNERRIFMFADIKNATSIAEQLGEKKYFNLLKDFFKDIAPAVIQTRGEVYQYVGDEVVISWKMKHGLTNANALYCFYIMKSLIESKQQQYLLKYDLVPDFKVGYHYGSVMVGELGHVKRDIAFSGDVLNTSSRIQAKCNELGVDILASNEFAMINEPLPHGITIETLGKQTLKGKSEEIELVTFRNEN